jgi:alpha-ketoglutarate-dependent taurine dioxygenase
MSEASSYNISNSAKRLVIESQNGKKIKDLELNAIMSLYEENKAVWFRGFDLNIDEFNELAGLFCKDFSNYQGGGSRWKSIDRQTVNNDKTLMTATGHTQDFTIPLHGEMYYMQDPPELLYFYCQTPPANGGQTILCDGAELFENLDAQTKAFFSSSKIKYIRHLPDGDWQTAFMLNDYESLKKFCSEKGTSLKRDENNAVITEYLTTPVIYRENIKKNVFINNLLYIYYAEKAFNEGLVKEKFASEAVQCPLIVRMENGEEIPQLYIEKVMKEAARITVDIDWQKGDVVMINNLLVLHGRKKSRGDERKILVKMGTYSNGI